MICWKKKGLVQRENVEEDRRAYHLSLTSSGKALVKQVIPIAKEVRAKGLAGMNEAEQMELKRLLNKIADNFL
ncbi:MAG: hypothetical protein HC912_05585 [Saprospiraceae bacterium]|nr:hypothetical protein [Saprospiraceae bacterium]